MNPVIQLKHPMLPLLCALTLAAQAFSPALYAQCPSLCDANGNTAEGFQALLSVTTGIDNTAIGEQALANNKNGNSNTATGRFALFLNISGHDNTAIGLSALKLNETGSLNTATGSGALSSNSTGAANTATGSGALLNNNGDNNTATGFNALSLNTTGSSNTADGFNALFSNTSGGDNTATGFQALLKNTTGINNTANGVNALANNTTGDDNVADGLFALDSNTTGKHNTANGSEALASNTSGSGNTAENFQALANNKAGSNNIALGVTAGLNLTTGSNNIDIGAPGVAAEANTIRIGKQGTQKKTFVAGIAGTPMSGSTVVVNSTGKLGVATSSARFKEAIKPMDKASEAILALKPVTFRYKEEVDPDRAPQFGLVAEDVEKVDPKLVIHDEQGKPFTVRYEAVNAMLLNEFIKEQGSVRELRATVAQQQKQIEALKAGLHEVAAQIDSAKERVAASGE